MPAKLTSEQVLVATNAFIATMRREWFATSRGGECPVRDLESYPARQRRSLLLAVKAACEASDPLNVMRVMASAEEGQSPTGS